jgi:dissimilatory sulfite reductase (desulfoviridin) alpha/beta subunit
MLMLESVRQIKYILEKIIINLSKWSKYSKKDMIERISCEVMYLVHKFRDVQEAFNTKFGADAYINLKTEELRRYIRTISNKQSIGEIRISFENYLAKINIDFESIQLLTNYTNGLK